MKYCSTLMFFNGILYLYQTGISGQESSLISTKVKDDAYKICSSMMDSFEIDLRNNNAFRGGKIVLIRCLQTYLACYLLHFYSNSIDKQRATHLLYKSKQLLDRQEYNRLIGCTCLKIPFIRLFLFTTYTSIVLYKLAKQIYTTVK